jgi:hypothetical protein
MPVELSRWLPGGVWAGACAPRSGGGLVDLDGAPSDFCAYDGVDYDDDDYDDYEDYD